jgi:hypothetical protein
MDEAERLGQILEDAGFYKQLDILKGYGKRLDALAAQVRDIPSEPLPPSPNGSTPST